MRIDQVIQVGKAYHGPWHWRRQWEAEIGEEIRGGELKEERGLMKRENVCEDLEPGKRKVIFCFSYITSKKN